jgi:hypothetical protein
MINQTTNDLREALSPIASLIRKSEKARQKLSPATWQHTMPGNNINALHIACALMNSDASAIRAMKRDDLQEAVKAFADMVSRTEKSRTKFLPGTSQHTLQRNRLRALRIAEALTKLELDRRNG